MSLKDRIYFRADGSSQIGLGHVIRSCALATMLKNDFECHFFIRTPSAALQQQIEKAGCILHPLPDNISYLEEAKELAGTLQGNEIIVLDGYNFVTAYQQHIRAKGNKLVCIDDIHAYHFEADAVINHGGGIKASSYSIAPFTRLYLGPGYALLRPAFLEKAGDGTIKEEEIFISMGGADPNNNTLQVLQFLETKGISNFCNIVIGDAYLHKDALTAFLAKAKLKSKIFQNISEKEMAGLMQRCKYAICPPSTVSYEYLTIGGELYIRTIADNQQEIYQFYKNEDLAFDLEEIFIQSHQRKAKSREKAQRLFDGKSQQRLLQLFSRIALENKLRIRQAQAEDVDQYYSWVNEPEVRNNSLSSDIITLEAHVNWFNRKIAGTGSRFFLLEENGTPVGQIRFDLEDDRQTATVNYSIDKDHRGKGLGNIIVKLGVIALMEQLPDIRTIKAIVKINNPASLQVFDSLRFEKEGVQILHGNECAVFNKKISNKDLWK